MTSRRYSELNNFDSTVENDENLVKADLGTPRSKAVPSKKTRVSKSPLTPHHQNVSFNPDKNLEETFLEKTIIPDEPQLLHKPVNYKPDNNLEETYFEQSTLFEQSLNATQEPSFLENIKTPDFSKILDSTLLKTPEDDMFADESLKSQDKTITDDAVETKDDNDQIKANTSIDQSNLSLPFSFNQQKVQLFNESYNALSFNNLYTITEVDSQGFNGDQSASFNKTQTSVTGDGGVADALKKVEITEFVQVSEAKEMETIDKEYDTSNILGGVSSPSASPFKDRNKDSPKKVEFAVLQNRHTPTRFGQSLTSAANISISMASFLEEEMQIFAEEPCKCDRFSSVIKEYKVICEKQKQISDNSNNNQEIFNLQEQVTRLNILLAEAKHESDLSKQEAANSKKDIDDFQFALDEEKRRAKTHIADLQKENFTLTEEMEVLKNTLTENGNIDSMKDELSALKEKLKVFDEVVLKGAEIESLYNKARTENKTLMIQKADLEGIVASMKITVDKYSNVDVEAMQQQMAEQVEAIEASYKKFEDALAETNSMKQQHEEEVAFQQVLNEELTQKLKAFEAHESEVNAENESLKQQLAQLQREMDQKDSNINENANLQTQIKEAEEKLFKTSEEMESVKSLFDELQIEMSKKDSTISEGIQNYDTLFAQKKEVDEKLLNALEEIEGLKQQIGELEIRVKENESFQNVVKDLEDKVSQKECLIATLQEGGMEAKKINALLNQEIFELRSQLEEKQKSIKELSEDVNIAEAENEKLTADYEGELAKSNAEIESFKTKCIGLQAQLKNNQALFQDMDKKVHKYDALRREKSEVEKMLGHANDEIIDLKSHISTLEKEMAHEKDDMEAKVKKVEANMFEAENSLAAFQEQKEKDTAMMDSLKQQVKNLSEELEVQEMAVAELTKKADAYDALLEQKTSAMKIFNETKAENEALKTQNSTFKERMDSMKSEKMELDARLETANGEIEKLKAARNKLEKKVEKLNAELDEAETAQKDSSEQLFALSAKLSKLKPEGDGSIRAAIDMAEIASPTQMSVGTENEEASFHSTTEEPPQQFTPEPLSPKDGEGDRSKTPKRKESLSSKIRSPFRRTKPQDASSQQHNASTCNQQ